MNVVKRNLYSIDVDTDANRLYITCHGIWNTVKDIPYLGEDLQAALEHLKTGFTCCTDMSDLKQASPDCNAQLSYTKMVLMEMGLSRDAFIVADDDKLSINYHSPAHTMEGKSFTSRAEAETWLTAC